MSRFTFFWQSESPFSQWHLSRFELDGHVYVTAEQWMMASKARLFGDEEIARRILGTQSPREQKAFGRKVRGFVPATWEAEREAIVYRGNHAKFTQHPKLLEALLATRGTTLVEASPLDQIWGIGLAADHPDAENPEQWCGLNLLGKVLTQLREDLIAEGHG
ncbi:MAG: NADAR family protein [Polyangiaceae bacterium]